MAEKAERGARRKRSRRRGFWATWRERLSFAVTLVTVSAVAIFLGWLMGQYAIQAVTGPAPSSTMAERPATPSAAGTVSSTATPSGSTSSGSSSATQPPSAATSSQPTSTAASTSSSTSAATPASGPTGSAAAPAPATTSAGQPSGLWRVQVGAFNDRSRAEALASELRARGYEVFVSGTAPHRVQAGAFSDPARAQATADDLRANGYEAIVIPPG